MAITLILAVLALVPSSISFAHNLKSFQDKDTQLWGLKNTRGQVVIKPQFQGVVESDPKDSTLISVYKDGHVYRTDLKGKIKFKSVYLDNGPDYYEQGLARFIEKEKVGFHDMKGQVVIKPTYDFASRFENHYSIVCEGCSLAYSKKVLFAPVSSSACPHFLDSEMEHDGIITGGKWGAINLKGEVVIPLKLTSWEDVHKKLETLE